MNRFLLLLLFCFAFLFCYGQKPYVRGVVYDKDTQEPIIGASVYEKDANGRILSGTVTDVFGNYSFQPTSSNSMLTFSFISYTTANVPLQGKVKLDVYMKPQSELMAEFKIEAKASSSDPLTGVSERDMSGSFSSLNMKDAATTSSNLSVDDALQGKMSGVDVVGGGSPGSGSSIIIRGMGSLGSSKPLIVIDGIPQDLDVSDFDFVSADQESIGDLVGVAFQDIQNINVLKDAAATAVWGSKGANGVILIKTKRGTGGKTKFLFQTKMSQDVEPSPIPMLNGEEYVMMQLEQLHAVNGLSVLPKELSNDKSLLGKDYYNYTADTDWMSEIMRKGLTQDYFFQFSGGGDKARYYTSVGYLDAVGTTLNTANNRLSTRVNVDYDISEKLKFNIQLSYSNIHKDNNYWGNGIRSSAYLRAPNMSVNEYDIDGNETGEYFNPISSYQSPSISSNYYNPVAGTRYSRKDEDEDKMTSTFNLNYSILDWLVLKEVYSYTYLMKETRAFLPEQAIGVDLKHTSNNQSHEGNLMSQRVYSRTQLLFTPDLGEKHSFVGTLNWELTSDRSMSFALATSNSTSSEFDDPGAGGTVKSTASERLEDRLLGGLSSVNYIYKDTYGLSANLKIEGLAKLSEASRWGFFPSLSGFWRFSNEPFLADVPWVNDSKLRASYGSSAGVGDLRVYHRHASYQGSSRQYWNNNVVKPQRSQLESLKYQTTYQANAGLDLAFFDSRLDVIMEVYKRTTTDLLIKDYNIPTSSGFDKLWRYNSGVMVNQGWEMFFNVRAIDKKDFRLNVDFNITRNRNSFDEFPGNINTEQGTGLGKAVYPVKFIEGKPIGSVFGLRYNGVYATDADTYARDANNEVITTADGVPLKMRYKNTYEFQAGDARYVDVNHDGNIDIYDAVYLGDSNPNFEGGFGLMATYKRNLTFACSFHTRVGYEVVNQSAIYMQSMDNKNNQSKAVLNRWRKPGDYGDKMLPRAYMGNTTNGLGSDLYVEDASFIRLKSLSVSYKLPKTFAERLNVRMMSVSLSARNVHTWTNYTGQDPEIRPDSKDATKYVRDTNAIPPTARYTMSLSLNF